MLVVNVKYGKINKDVLNGVQMQLVYEIIDETGSLVKYKIIDEDGTILFSTDNFIFTPFEETKYFFLSASTFYVNTFRTIYIEVENELGTKKKISYNIDTFDIQLDERINGNNFTWYLYNFSKLNINSQIEIINSSNLVVATGNKFNCNYTPSHMINKDTVDLSLLPKDLYHYRIKYWNVEENWERYYPNEKGLMLKYRDNESPTIYIKDYKLTRDNIKSIYDLYFNVIFRDYNLDDVKYRVQDEYKNIIIERNEYDYIPKIEEVNYEYKIDYFNHLYLTLNLQVMDVLTYQTIDICKIPLFEIYNLRRYQDKMYWHYRNYTNKEVYMQLEVLDFYDNIVLKGHEILKKNENEFVELVEENELLLEVDYYKFRLHVWNKLEKVDEYYELDYGTQFTILEHEPPIISNLTGQLSRDLDDNKKLNLKAYITDKENDPFQYTVSDESGELIFQTRDKINTPYRLNLNCNYNFISKTRTNITLSVTDSHNGNTKETIELLAFNIKELQETNGYIFNWKLDNMSEQELGMQIEIMETNGDTFKILDPLYQGYTENYTMFEQRIIPKLDAGTYKYRLKIFEKENPDIVYYFPDENGVLFSCTGNRPPIIDVENYDYFLVDSNTLKIRVKGTFSDPDYDRIKYFIKDDFESYLLKEDEYKTSPRTFFVEKDYNIGDFNTAKFPMTIEVEDEEGLTETLQYNIDLFSISNIYRIYNKFYWSYRTFSNKPIITQLEIIDEQGYLYGVGDLKYQSSTFEFREITQEMDFKRYEEGNYFFRVKVTSEGENWYDYIPNNVGIPFYLKYNNPPKIKIDNIITKDSNTINIQGNIEDKDNDKVYYTIKDNIQ